MSDPFTDVARAHREWLLANRYLQAIVEFLETGTDEARQLVTQCASDEREYVFGRRWIRDDEFDISFPAFISGLLNGGEKEWARLLVQLEGDASRDYYERAKALSPFKDQIVVHVHHGVTWLHLEGDSGKRLAESLWKASGYDYADDLGNFAIILPHPDPSAVKVIKTDTD